MTTEQQREAFEKAMLRHGYFCLPENWNEQHKAYTNEKHQCMWVAWQAATIHANAVIHAEIIGDLPESPPPTGFRLLNEGELMRRDDEWYVHSLMEWRVIQIPDIGEPVNQWSGPIRRRFIPSPSLSTEEVKQIVNEVEAEFAGCVERDAPSPSQAVVEPNTEQLRQLEYMKLWYGALLQRIQNTAKEGRGSKHYRACLDSIFDLATSHIERISEAGKHYSNFALAKMASLETALRQILNVTPTGTVETGCAMRTIAADALSALSTLQPESPCGCVEKVGAYERWVDSEEAQEFAGKHIAYLEGDGAVEWAETLDELMIKVANHPRAKEITIGYVPTILPPNPSPTGGEE